MSRAVIGVSTSLHADLKQISKDSKLPLTVILAHWVENCSEEDWASVKKAYDNVKPTWKNIKKVVQEYQQKFPEADEEQLSGLTGYSVAQIETITLAAHIRVLAYMKSSPQSKPERIAKECSTSVRFSTRIYEISKGDKKPSKYEAHLFEGKK